MEHVRIDEGVKRGPRKKPGPKPSSPRRANGQIAEILSNDPADIQAALQDYINGATLKEIGQRHGVTRQAVYGWLLGELGGEQHSALVTRALTARIAKGDETLDSADNPLDLQRGREQARNARLDLERRRSSLYGQKQELTITDKTDLGDRLRRSRERVIEGESTVIAAPAQPSQIIELQPIASQHISPDPDKPA